MSLQKAFQSMNCQTEDAAIKRGITANHFVLSSLLSQEDDVIQQKPRKHVFLKPNTIKDMLVLLDNPDLIELILK